MLSSLARPLLAVLMVGLMAGVTLAQTASSPSSASMAEARCRSFRPLPRLPPARRRAAE